MLMGIKVVALLASYAKDDEIGVTSKDRHPESSATDSSWSGIRTLVFEATPRASPDNQRLESRLPANWESSPVYLDSATAATLLSDPANLEAAT